MSQDFLAELEQLANRQARLSASTWMPAWLARVASLIGTHPLVFLLSTSFVMAVLLELLKWGLQ